jgi:hypothetical protein
MTEIARHGSARISGVRLMNRYYGIRAAALAAGILALAQPAMAFEFSGFRMGMSEPEIFEVARQYGYKLQQTDRKPNFSSYYWQAEGRSGYVSLCNGRVFGAGSTFDATVHSFIGLILERQNQFGEAQWKVSQSYSADGQQFSSLEAVWDYATGRFQPSVSLLAYGPSGMKTPRVSISYSAHKYMCRG